MNNDVPFVFESIFKEELHNYILSKKAQGLQFHRTKCLRIKKMDIFFKDLNLQKKQINSNIVDMWLKKAPTIKAKTKLTFCQPAFVGLLHLYAESPTGPNARHPHRTVSANPAY